MICLDSGEILLDEKDINVYLKNRPPFLFIDSARVYPGRLSSTKKTLSSEEWFFPCHFPGNPMMPGVLQLETIFQTAAMAIKTIEGYRDKTTNIAQIYSVKYTNHIRPGDTISVKAEVKRFRRGLADFIATIKREKTVCCEASFLLVVLDDIPEMEDKNGINE